MHESGPLREQATAKPPPSSREAKPSAGCRDHVHVPAVASEAVVERSVTEADNVADPRRFEIAEKAFEIDLSAADAPIRRDECDGHRMALARWSGGLRRGVVREHEVSIGRLSVRPETSTTSLRILAFAYACEPGRGSEPGAGWAWARMLARLGETWVITRRDYEASIEQALGSIPERRNLRFVYVELPQNLRSWQRGLRGLRIYYLLWQVAALREARRLQHSKRFDVVWHLTWANAWYGTLAAVAGRPFVYGPVGGCVGTVWRLLPDLGWNGASYEIARSIIHAAARYANPLARISWRRADLILAQNPETRDWFPRRHRHKARVFHNAVIREDLVESETVVRAGPPRAVYAGRLEPFKGVFLCLYALSLLPGWRLAICGAGNDQARLRRLSRRLGVEDRVEWLGWLPQADVLRTMSEADVLLFPSLHEEAGAVVAEARAAGIPIVCLARGGPPLLAGPHAIAVAESGDVRHVAQRLAKASITALGKRRERQDDVDDLADLMLDSRTKALRQLLQETMPLPPELLPLLTHEDA